MEPLFTNSCLLTKEVYQEAFSSIRKFKKLIFAILLFCLTVFLIFEAIRLEDWTFYLYAFVFVSYPIYALFIAPLINAKMIYNRGFEINHEPTSHVTLFFDDHILLKSTPSKAEASLQYEQLIRVEASRQLYILTIKKNMLLILDKSKFDKINLIEFELFLHQKAPKAKFLL